MNEKMIPIPKKKTFFEKLISSIETDALDHLISQTQDLERERILLESIYQDSKQETIKVKNIDKEMCPPELRNSTCFVDSVLYERVKRFVDGLRNEMNKKEPNQPKSTDSIKYHCLTRLYLTQYQQWNTVRIEQLQHAIDEERNVRDLYFWLMRCISFQLLPSVSLEDYKAKLKRLEETFKKPIAKKENPVSKSICKEKDEMELLWEEFEKLDQQMEMPSEFQPKPPSELIIPRVIHRLGPITPSPPQTEQPRPKSYKRRLVPIK